MTADTQEILPAMQHEHREKSSQLEAIAFSTLGAISGTTLTGAFMYDPISAAVCGVVGGGVGGVVGGGVGCAFGCVVGGAFCAFGAVVGGVVSGVSGGAFGGVGGAFGAFGAVVGGVVGGVVSGGAAIYLSDKTYDVRKRLTKVLAGSALIASLATGAGYGISSYEHRINAVRQFHAGEEQGIVVETPRNSQIYLLRNATNYVSLDDAVQQELRAVDDSYTGKEKEIRAQYDVLSRTAQQANKLKSPKK